jgi:hypothetical protein
VSGFFEPPPTPWPEQAAPGNSPPWTGRPQGPPLGATVGGLLLARSELAAVYVDYVDAYREGFELEIRASTSAAYDELGREGDVGTDVFGRHWPMVGERRDVLPPQLLRIGVQFADGRTATNIGGHDRPVDGPLMGDLRGGGRGSGEDSRFHQGYWVSPLPPPGPVGVVCEWPAVGIPVARLEIDAQLILDAAVKARAMFGDGSHVLTDGRAWRLATDNGHRCGVDQRRDVGEHDDHVRDPPAFASYCTLELPKTKDRAESTRHEQAVIELLTKQTPRQPWWLGYLDTGASDVVFPCAPRTTVYYGYGYVLVEAGPPQATGWRDEGFSWTLPELMFPANRSWLASTMWDDGWTSIGGSQQLVEGFLSDTTLGPRGRRVALGQASTPSDPAAN